ncbi:hypothetical protein [Tautonia sociabilis]|uniref:Uncharacterized protein n=1 Tax=Tautonia sociabilis TaxID=2080755 RepID=A0A432MJM9_9BACT|nr:hypothetical protein [Tautonia sociabilis]RUL87613.1 hypothetical protein TsocGM_11425 [Tautonia sociabilis]
MSHADPFDLDGRREDLGPGPRRRFVAWGRRIALATLLVLVVAIAAQGRRHEDHPPAPAPAEGVGALPPLPPPDDSPAFRAIRDETPVRFAETAAYAELLDRVRRTPPERLREQARTEVVFSDLLARPDRYRGLPIRLQGTARRILPLEDLPQSLAPHGRLYEAWTFTGDSRGYPYVLVFEDAPEGLPAGDDVRAFVVFHGYFFKLLAYNAADKPRKAPMLIGRIEYIPDEAGAPVPPGLGGSRPVWLLAPIALLVAYLFARTMTTARSLFRSTSGRRFHSPPREEISPEELDDWLHGRSEDPDEPPPDRPPS